ncbi:MAG TPA: site-2 protease family protein [Candidatus Limnocylindrales bacterium]|nr:site-2 protease family protein [Candidatus Limnocylindrales bacterium]
MDDQLIAALLAVGVIILVAFPVHEFCHAWAAYMLGDSTARWQGRLSLNPIVHFDPFGGIVLLLTALLQTGFFIGWAKPTPVNPYNLRYGRRGEAMVAALGPVSNLVLAIVVAVPLQLAWGDPGLRSAMLGSFPLALLNNVAVMWVIINAILFLFNLLPIAPLDGWKVVSGLVSARIAYQMRQVEQYGFLILLAVIFLGMPYISPVISGFVRLFTGSARLIGLGL